MPTLNLPENLSRALMDEARKENLTVEEFLWSKLSQPTDADQSPSMPAWKRDLRRKLYKMARDYWRKSGDATRLALTDAELDVQFWLIDHEGIPRLIEDQGKVEIAPDPLEELAGIFDDGPDDLSESVHDTMRHFWRRKAEDESRYAD
jgi:hypothetical protein